MGEKAAHYREQAERCRKLALSIPDAEMKEHMLDVAQQYDRLADEVEAKE